MRSGLICRPLNLVIQQMFTLAGSFFADLSLSWYGNFRRVDCLDSQPVTIDDRRQNL